MGGNYEKSVYNQLMEVMEKLNSMESEHSRDRKEVKELTTEVTGLRKENAHLREEVSNLKQKTSSLEEENTSLKAENRLLYDDNERMKRMLDNDSSNSSTPSSKDQPGKADPYPKFQHRNHHLLFLLPLHRADQEDDGG